MSDPVTPGRIRCVIVDDEPLARCLLETYVGEHPLLVNAGSCESGFEAFALLQTTPVDLLFLDIQMPRLTGLALTRALPSLPKVIFTTAYAEFAAEAFDVAAVDYLLKPIGRERFIRAVARVIEAACPVPIMLREERALDAVYIRVDQQLVRVPLDEIIFVEACENYVRYHTLRRAYLTKRTLAEVESSLPADRFVRVHRSFLVNLARIERLEGHLLVVGGKEVPVSRSLRAALLDRLPIA
jgi:DNA-binding LytR/AlgR family response regulator